MEVRTNKQSSPSTSNERVYTMKKTTTAAKNTVPVESKVETPAIMEKTGDNAVKVIASVEVPEGDTISPVIIEEAKTPPVDINVNNTTAYKLQSFTAIPDRIGGGRKKYDFDSMVPGKWFFIPNDGKEDASKKLSTAASSAGRKLGKKFTVRTMEHEGLKGAGVFCIDPNS